MISSRALISLVVAWGAAFLPVLPARAAADDLAIAARSAAFDLAGAFSANDGYKLRDGYFTTTLKPGESRIFAVNLYSGNSYWFCVATAPAVRKIEVQIFDETGQPLPIQPYTDGPRAAAGLTAIYSGTYYIKMAVVEGAVGQEGQGSESSTACLLYAYK